MSDSLTSGASHLTAMLFVPAGDPRKVAKIDSLTVDVIILDLEDAVARSAKAGARSRAAAFLTGRPDARPRTWVRINGFETGLAADDLDAVAVHGLDGVVVPKVSGAADVREVADALAEQEERRALVPGSVGIIATIETVAGVMNLSEIATADPRLQLLGFGAGDLSLELGLDWPSRDASVSPTLIAAKAQLVLASRHAGLQAPHDSVYPDFGDLGGLRREAELARSMGFGGKHAIHPLQVPVIEEVFRHSRASVEHAHKVILAFEEAERDGLANAQVDGRLVDYPVAERARRVVESAEEVGS